MRIIAFITDYAVVDRIINHLKLTFVADRLTPSHFAYQGVLIAEENLAASGRLAGILDELRDLGRIFFMIL
ncbi:MAG: hypothetical protein ACUVV5_12095 [Candidatus Aminicenantales bacterium]